MTDLAEFLGTVIALYLLFGIPLLIGTFVSVFDVILILGITGGKVRRVEYFFMVFISIIGIGYVYEIFITGPNLAPVIAGSLIPNLGSTERILIAVGVIGATVMPHAVFVHSALANDKVTDPSMDAKRRVMRLHRIESIIMFTFAGLVNAAIMVMASAAFYSHGIFVATIEEAYLTLLPLFGSAAAIVFGVTLLASGLSSSTTATIAGQAILLGIEPLVMLVYSQVALSLLLPLPLLPLWKFTRDRKLMGELVNRRITTILATIFIVLILSLNAVLLYLSFGGQI
jgi:manganese transport protein